MAEALAKIKDNAIHPATTGDTDGSLLTALIEALTAGAQLNVGQKGRTTHSPTNYTKGGDASDIVDNHLAGIDTELGGLAASPHALGGSDHSSATLAELNALVSNATLDDQGSSRTPLAHKDSHKSAGPDPFASTDLLEAMVKRLQITGPVTLLVGAVADGQYLKRSGTAIVGDAPTAGAHLLGGTSHTADSLANLNSKINLGDLDFDTAARPAIQHALGSSVRHSADSLANLNALVTGGSLDFSTASRPPNGSASGDLADSYPGPTVAKIRGYAVQDHAPADGESLIWKASASQYEPGTPNRVSQVAASGELTLTTSYQDIAGMTKTFTPPRACVALVICTFVMRAGTIAAAHVLLYGQLLKDAAAIDNSICLLVATGQRNVFTMVAAPALAADTEVTIKAQAKKDSSTDAYYAGGFGRMVITLLPNVAL